MILEIVFFPALSVSDRIDVWLQEVFNFPVSICVFFHKTVSLLKRNTVTCINFQPDASVGALERRVLSHE